MRSLIWWSIPKNLLSGVPLGTQSHGICLFTDASLRCWGVHCQGLRVTGTWSAKDSTFHINLLELRTIRLVLTSFAEIIQGRHFLIETDNVTAKFYLNKQGGLWSLHLWRKAMLIWQWAIRHRVQVTAVHIVDKSKQHNSRHFKQGHMCRARVVCIRPLSGPNLQGRGGPEVELFASVDNKTCFRAAMARGSLEDAFKWRWHGDFFYMFSL